MNFQQNIELIAGHPVTDISPMGGGCVGKVFLVKLKGGQKIVAKIGEPAKPSLDVEGYMLNYLAVNSDLPVPEVISSSPELLLISYIDGDSHFSNRSQGHAAELLADLHKIGSDNYGLGDDTLIGGLHQPNKESNSWLEFFRDHRLLYMSNQGFVSGRLPETVFRRVCNFCDKLDRWLITPAQPSLIHGDVWTTNVLAKGSKIVGFIDPAIYYADPEIELAFISLFSTFGETFFSRYQEIKPISPGFFEERKDIYNLYPLLVHVRLFGGSYVQSVDRILRKFGF